MWKAKVGTKRVQNNEIYYINKEFKKNDPSEISKTVEQKEFKVDLKTGEFTVDGEVIPHGASIPASAKLRWINFQRVRHIVDWTTNEPKSTDYTYFMGWQTTVSGNNVKRMLRILPDGGYTIVEDS